MTEERRRRRRRRRTPRTPLRRLRHRLGHRLKARPRVTLAVTVVLVLGVLWVGWTVWSTSRALEKVENRAEVMRAALMRGDAQGARKAMAAYQDAAETAEARTGGLTWSALELIPLLGDDLEGVEVVSAVLAGIGRDGLPPVADAAEQVSAEGFRPRGHVFPIETIAAMAGPAQRSEAAFDEAGERLATLDPDGFVGPIQTRLEKLRTLVTDARSTLGSTYRASRLMPTMLGEERPRHFLIVLQNNAEMRSSGGLPGALSLVRAQEGRVEIVEQTDMSDLGQALPGLEFKVTAEERRLFGDFLGGIAVNATLTPDFPRAAQLVRARWERVMGGKVDGVIFVDPVAVSYLLHGTGEVPVPGYPAVSHRNVVAAVENEIYRLTPDRQEHSDYQQAVAEAVFDAFADGRGDSVQGIRGLATGVAEGRIRMHFFHQKDQREVAGTQIAGEFSSEPGPQPQVGIYINDAGPTKMQYYLRYDASLFARACGQDDAQVLAGSMEFVSDVPPGDLPAAITGEGYRGSRVEPGEQLLIVYLTAPVGGTLEKLAIDGQAIAHPAVVRFGGREVAVIGIRLDRQDRQTVDFTLRSGPDQAGDPSLEVSPGAVPGTSNTSVPSSCTTR